MPEDFQDQKPTKAERLMYEIVLKIDTLEKNFTAIHRILTGIIGATDMDIPQLIKTVRNDVRFKSTLASMQKAEMDVVASEAADTLSKEQVAKADEGSTINTPAQPAEAEASQPSV